MPFAGIAPDSLREVAVNIIQPARHAVVLYVDDQPTNTLVMRSLLRHRPGIELVVASDGRHGLQRAAASRPDLLLLDLDLPDCRGTQLLQQLRTLTCCAETPAVAVTADAFFDPSDTGFVEVWRKPLDMRAVLDRLDALLDPPPPRTGPAFAAAAPSPLR